MNTNRDKAVLAALEHITDVLAMMENAMHLQINYDKSKMDAAMIALHKTVEAVRDSIDDF